MCNGWGGFNKYSYCIPNPGIVKLSSTPFNSPANRGTCTASKRDCNFPVGTSPPLCDVHVPLRRGVREVCVMDGEASTNNSPLSNSPDCMSSTPFNSPASRGTLGAYAQRYRRCGYTVDYGQEGDARTSLERWNQSLRLLFIE